MKSYKAIELLFLAAKAFYYLKQKLKKSTEKSFFIFVSHIILFVIKNVPRLIKQISFNFTDFCYHLPDLKNIVILHWSNNKVILLIPTDIIDFSSMSSMHKKQFWRSILQIFILEFLSASTDIPNNNSTVCWTTLKYSRIKGRPFTSHNLNKQLEKQFKIGNKK